MLGQQVWNNPALNRLIGLCPEQDAFYEWMTGWDFVYTCARLSGLSRPAARAAAARTIDAVGMTQHQDRAIRGYSKGMRQRTKLAQALVHDPDVLFLDEPLTGTDPVARRDLMDIIRRLGARGQERARVEPRAARGAVADAEHHPAEPRPAGGRGARPEIRDLIDKHPHHIVLVCDDYRRLAGRAVDLGRRGGRPGAAARAGPSWSRRTPRTPSTAGCPALSLEDGLAIKEVYSDDDNLEAVFKYLVSK